MALLIRLRRLRLVRTLIQATQRFNAEAGTFMAPSIAFSIISSAVPVTLVAVATMASLFGDAAGIAHVRESIHEYAPQLQTLLTQNLDAVVQYRGLSGAIGILSLIWAGKNLFTSLIYALNRAFGVSESRWFLWDILIAVAIVPLVGVAVLIATLAPVVVTLAVQFAHLQWLAWLPQIGTYASSLGVIFFVFALLYGLLPNRKTRWPAVFAGAAAAAIGYTLAQIAFAKYTSYVTSVFAIYGALSAVFALILWLYYGTVLFLFGAFVSAAWEKEPS
jgi:membrane protein